MFLLGRKAGFSSKALVYGGWFRRTVKVNLGMVML